MLTQVPQKILLIKIAGKASEVFNKIKILGYWGKRLQIDELARLSQLKERRDNGEAG